MIRSAGRSYSWGGEYSGASAHTVPTGRVAFLGRIPGNKLLGYDYPVPPGQKSDASLREQTVPCLSTFSSPQVILPETFFAFFAIFCGYSIPGPAHQPIPWSNRFASGLR